MSSFLHTLNRGTARTFRTKHGRTAGQSESLREFAQSTLGSDALKEAVKLPPGEDEQEWIAVHVVDFHNQINMLYSTITLLCSPTSCPKMTAGEKYEYLWQDSNSPKYRKPTKVSAPEYIENLLKWTHERFLDPHYFPTELGVEFPPDARSMFQQILKRLFRVYAHIYYHHIFQITELGLQPHLNTSLKHFVLFCNQFQLVPKKEFEPLDDLIQCLIEEH